MVSLNLGLFFVSHYTVTFVEVNGKFPSSYENVGVGALAFDEQGLVAGVSFENTRTR